MTDTMITDDMVLTAIKVARPEALTAEQDTIAAYTQLHMEPTEAERRIVSALGGKALERAKEEYRAALCAVLPDAIAAARADERAKVLNEIADNIDPEIGLRSYNFLRLIHVDVEIRGRKDPNFEVNVHHRNIVLSATANAIRSSHGLTWEEWLTHCGDHQSLWPHKQAARAAKEG